MTRDTKDFCDPLIDEVRARRQQLWDACDRDIRKLYERIQQLQRQHPEKLIQPPTTGDQSGDQQARSVLDE